jgi:hypothetical protein
MTALLNRQKFYYDKTGVFLTPASHSPETAVGVHGFSVFFSWQFHQDKTGVFLPPASHSPETCL